MPLVPRITDFARAVGSDVRGVMVEPHVVWGFNKQGESEGWAVNADNTTSFSAVSPSEGRVRLTRGQTYLVFRSPLFAQIKGAENPIVVFRCRTSTARGGTYFGMFADANNSFSTSTRFKFTMRATTAWQYIVVDVAAQNELWKQSETINQIRLDNFGRSALGEWVEIEFVAIGRVGPGMATGDLSDFARKMEENVFLAKQTFAEGAAFRGDFRSLNVGRSGSIVAARDETRTGTLGMLWGTSHPVGNDEFVVLGGGGTSTPSICRILVKSRNGYDTGWNITEKGIVPYNNYNGVDIGEEDTVYSRIRRVHTTDGITQVSDARLKTEPRAMTDEERQAALAIARKPMFWSWLREGEGARLHAGPTVQSIVETLEQHGLDWRNYAFIEHHSWPEQAEVVHTISAVVGEDGEEIEPERTIVLQAKVEAGDVYSLVKDELALFILSAVVISLEKIE